MGAVCENGNQAAAIEKALDAMWVKFLPEIRERVRTLETAAQVAMEGSLGEEQREAAQWAAHKLAGTLGTFGLERGTELARALDVRFAHGEVGVSEAAEVKDAAAELRTMVENRKSF